MKIIANFAAGLLVVQAASAGVYIETVERNLATGESSLDQKMYIQNGVGRFMDGDGQGTLIKGDTIYVIDDGDKSYVELDKATMQQLATRMNAELAKVKEQLAKLPAEQRAQMEQMMGGAMLGGDGVKWTVEVRDTGRTDKVDGRACKVWDVTRNGELDEQICVVPYSALPGNENLEAMFANFAKVFEEMAKSVPMLSGMMTNEWDAQAKTKGFPMRRRDYENGKLGGEETVVKVWREQAIPASTFEIPAGYKKKQMPMGPAR